MQVAEVVQPALERRAASVLVISFGTPAAVASYRARTGLPFVFAADPGREAYQAYGMLRASRWRVWHPRVLWGYLVLTLRGMRPRRAASGEDLSQLGGDFVIGPDGRLRLAHVSQGPEDRPSALRLLSAL